MIDTLTFDNLTQALRDAFDNLPDYRTGNNTTYEISDAALGAFSVFFAQSPSFLQHQRDLERKKGKNNARSLFGIEEIPTPNQIRNLLDPISPHHLYELFDQIWQTLAEAGELDDFRAVNGTLLCVLDGTQYFSSYKIHCPHCLQRTIEDKVLYYHQVLLPALVAPRKETVISLAPEFIVPQDGTEKQDCEIEAAKRLVKRQGEQLAEAGATLLGDDIFCHQPFCQQVMDAELFFLFVCKPESHETLYEWIETLDRGDGLHERKERHWNGQHGEIWTYRFVNEVPLRAGDDALIVNWCEVTITHETTGERLYHNAFATNHRVRQENVADLIEAGRTHWKIENENNNVLKNQGYHLEHNFGHGENHLSAVLLTLNLLAFLLHTVFALIDETYQWVRDELGARRTFFNDVRALTRYHVFKSWQALLDFMVKGLQTGVPPDSTEFQI